MSVLVIGKFRGDTRSRQLPPAGQAEFAKIADMARAAGGTPASGQEGNSNER